GVRLLSDGDLQAAEQVLRQALGAKLVSSTKEVPKLVRQSRQRETEDKNATIRLYLARVYLEGGQPDLAEKEVVAAQQILDVRQEASYKRWLTRTTARIEILRGEYEPAFKRLNKSLLVKDESDSTEGYLLLAIAARALGKEQVLDEAMAAAEEKGADVRLLAGNNP
ncbi:MAG: tetratricopeptide repeat protein, partial [Acidobacteria bacterium]|nr:tetratricopeptide repeat protein [Acidobacteriota bacterium]